MDRRILMLSILMILTSTIIFNFNIENVFSEKVDGGYESLTIYTSSTSIYVKASIKSSRKLFNHFIDEVSSNHVDGVKKVSLSFIRVFDWKNTYSYFINNIWYNDTGIEEVPTTYAIIKFYLKGNSSTSGISLYIDNVSRYYYLYFSKVYEGKNIVEYVSPYQHDVSFTRIVSILGENYPAVFKWIGLDRFDTYDFYNITLVIDYDISSASFKASYINYQREGISSLMKLFNWYQVKNDTRNIYLTLYSRFSQVDSYPSLYNLSVIDPSTLFTSLKSVSTGNSTKNPFDIDLRFDLPYLYIERSFNNTQPMDGDSVEITLTITNKGGFDVKNVHVSEPHWWDDKKILFIGGDTEKSYGDITSSSSRVLRYIVKINTSKPLDISIPSSNITVELYNNTVLSYTSSENVIHLNSNSPFLKVSIERKTGDIRVGEKFKYDLSVINIGNSSAYALQLGSFLIKSLKPGETKTVELEVGVDSVRDLIKQVSSKIIYSFSNKTFEIFSQSYPILFRSVKIMAPSAYLFIGYMPLNDSYVKAVFKINNIGVENIPKLRLEGRILSGLEYVSGNFTYNSEDRIFYIDDIVLGVGGASTYYAKFRLVNSDVFLYPVVKLYFSDGKIMFVRDGLVDIFYNKSLSLTKIFPEPPLLTGKEYNFILVLLNNGSAPLYNITASLKEHPININFTAFPHEIDHVSKGERAEFKFSFYGIHQGNITFPGVKIGFILGGRDRKIDIASKAASFVYGLKMDLALDKKDIVENRYTGLKIVLETDSPTSIHDINIMVKLPNGLSFRDGEKVYSMKINNILRKHVIRLEIYGRKPGKYNISDVLVTYYFKDKKIDLSAQHLSLPYTTLIVKENIMRRYFIYFILGIVIAFGAAIYLRRMIGV